MTESISPASGLARIIRYLQGISIFFVGSTLLYLFPRSENTLGEILMRMASTGAMALGAFFTVGGVCMPPIKRPKRALIISIICFLLTGGILCFFLRFR